MDTLDRFWAKVERRGPDECWPWRGAANFKGYGRFYLAGGPFVQSTRYSYELAHGPIPVGAHMLHRCDNPPCVNPAHLFVGDPRANMADCMRKGRNYPPPHHLGERNHAAKLSVEQVRDIRRRAELGEQRKDIAAVYNVAPANVSQIVLRRTWKEVS